MQTIKQYLLFVCTCLIAFACDQPLFEQYQAIEHDAWEKDNAYYFTFEIKDASIAYDLTLEIRNNNLYPFQNLWILGQTIYPDSTVRRDTTEFQLADEFGKWKGKGISIFQSSQPLLQRFYFPQAGQYTMGIRQGMRQDALPGIQGIGLRINETW